VSDSNVSQLPVDPNFYFRKAIELLNKYLDQVKPNPDHESVRAEMALFDQIVAIRLSSTSMLGKAIVIEDAVKDAVHAITERRKLFLSVPTPEKVHFS
jgi:hypothetical protein